MACRVLGSEVESASPKASVEWLPRSVGRRSPIVPFMLYAWEVEKTSAVMVVLENSLGGDEELELLREPWRNGLLDKFEGLVLLGLGPPAISSFVVELSWRSWGNKERRSGQVNPGGADQRSESRGQSGGAGFQIA